MALVVPDVSEVALLKRMLGYSATGDQIMHLYTNDLTPTEDTSLVGTNAPTQSSANGYAQITLTSGNWAVSTVAGTTSGVYAEQTYTYSTSETLYGYYVTDSGGTNLLWIERFTGAPFILPSSGGQVAITPTINLA
jgi:hypothetical protein